MAYFQTQPTKKMNTKAAVFITLLCLVTIGGLVGNILLTHLYVVPNIEKIKGLEKISLRQGSLRTYVDIKNSIT